MSNNVNLDTMKATYEKFKQDGQVNPILAQAIEKEIKVKEYALDPDAYERNIRNEAAREAANEAKMKERRRGNHRLKVYKTRNAIIFTAVLILAAPVIVEGTKVVMNKIIEIDNENFEKDIEQQRQQVEELTGHTMEEIMERGNSR